MDSSAVLRTLISATFVANIVRVTAPLYLAAIGGILTGTSGKSNVALEGTMLTSAFFGMIVSYWTQSWVWGLLGGVVSGILFSAILALFILELDTHEAIAGLGMNIFASGLTVFLLYILAGEKGTSISLASKTVPSIEIPIIKDIPVIGTMLSGHNIFVYLSIVFALLLPVFLYRTKLGIYMRASGVNEEACTSLGINVKKIRWISFLMSGFFAGLAGVNLSMSYSSFFIRDMASGRGFIALAAVGLGNQRPWGVLLSTLLFGASEALGSQLSTLDIFPQLIISIPYVVTLVALVYYKAQELREIQNRRHQKLAEKLGE